MSQRLRAYVYAFPCTCTLACTRAGVRIGVHADARAAQSCTHACMGGRGHPELCALVVELHIAKGERERRQRRLDRLVRLLLRVALHRLKPASARCRDRTEHPNGDSASASA
eukprot:1046495-Pleurochrysis_carterae.AAC.2